MLNPNGNRRVYPIGKSAARNVCRISSRASSRLPCSTMFPGVLQVTFLACVLVPAVPGALPVPTGISLEILTPPDKRIAGDTILFVMRVADPHGLIPGALCYGGAGDSGLIVSDNLWRESQPYPLPFAIVDGEVVEIFRDASEARSHPVCFTDGVDTIGVVLYYAPFDPDSLHRLTFQVGAMSMPSDQFRLLPAGIEDGYVRITNENKEALPDTIRLAYPDAFVVAYSTVFDRNGNQAGFAVCDWSVTGSLPPVTGLSGAWRVFFDVSAAECGDEQGFLVARHGEDADSVFVVIDGLICRPLVAAANIDSQDVNPPDRDIPDTSRSNCGGCGSGTGLALLPPLYLRLRGLVGRSRRRRPAAGQSR